MSFIALAPRSVLANQWTNESEVVAAAEQLSLTAAALKTASDNATVAGQTAKLAQAAQTLSQSVQANEGFFKASNLFKAVKKHALALCTLNLGNSGAVAQLQKEAGQDFMALNYHLFARSVEKSANIVAMKAELLASSLQDAGFSSAQTWGNQVTDAALSLNAAAADNAPFHITWNEALELHKNSCGLEATLSPAAAAQVSAHLKSYRAAFVDLKIRLFVSGPSASPVWAPSC